MCDPCIILNTLDYRTATAYTRVPVETTLPYQVAAIAFFVAPVKRLVPVPMFTGALDEGSSSEGIIVAVGTHAEGDRGHKALCPLSRIATKPDGTKY